MPKKILIFKHPPTGTASPLTDFEPENRNHYPTKGVNGVYIYGLRAKVNGALKFIPIVVGEGNLHQRLFKDHYKGKFLDAFENLTSCKKKGLSSSNKEIWDFSKKTYDIKALSNIYTDMKSYNGFLGTRSKLSSIVGLKSLLYFQNIDFYNIRHGLGLPFSYGPNIRSEQAVLLLAERILFFDVKINKTVKCVLKTNCMHLILTLQNFVENFYYVYAVDDDYLNDKNNRYSAEYRTKAALSQLGIHTTAADLKKGNKDDSPSIDLSEVQGELVNMGGHPYNDEQGNYLNPLIL